jgi:flagellar biosynthesis protein
MPRLALKAEALLALDKKTRKAVALAYEINSAAPRITGQGEGFVADAILAKAKEMGIPTRTEPELVEFLMQLKLNELVPPKLYAAVAEVLAWAYDLDGKTVPNPNNIPIDSR